MIVSRMSIFLSFCQNYGAFLEKDGAEFRGPIKVNGCKNGDVILLGHSGLTRYFSIYLVMHPAAHFTFLMTNVQNIKNYLSEML